MRLIRIRLRNFQCFGQEPTALDLDDITYLLGPNGAGKTSVLTALARMFAIDPQLRRVRHSDFHVPLGTAPRGGADGRALWIEVDFEFPELAHGAPAASVPSFFSQMRISRAGEVPRLRIRLTAAEDDAGDIDTRLAFVTAVDGDGEPVATTELDRYERAAIQVHYLPARRDPAQHIAHTGNTLLGRLLRAVDWSAELPLVDQLAKDLSDSLVGNAAITSLCGQLIGTWNRLHTGAFFTTPSVTFTGSDVETLLRHLNIAFDTAPYSGSVDWTRLSDGQQSLLYLTIVLALHGLGSQVLAGSVPTVSPAKLRPATFTLIALEEPENSLSPHYVGRITRTLTDFSAHPDAQAIIATHSPSVVHRVPPESIRHLRLDTSRRTAVTRIELPPKSDEAHKFVREAVEAFPELYFSRLVILGEGDGEQVVLPRVLDAAGVSADLGCVSIVPLGGRHVNHFWRLLSKLGIPYLTLLDFDTARYQGGWGRIHYALSQLLEHPPAHPPGRLDQSSLDAIPAWADPSQLVDSPFGEKLLNALEGWGVYFSAPLDLDFSMLTAYPGAYQLRTDQLAAPTPEILTAVLGKARALEAEQYSAEQMTLFAEYHRMFNNGSKPTQHLSALSDLTNQELLTALPAPLSRLVDAVKSRLAELPE